MAPKDPTGKPPRARAKPRSPKKRRGPKPGITDELTARICVAIVVGASLDGAAAACGVPPSTFWDWLKRGRAEDAIPVYRDFVDQVEQALGRFELEKSSVIDKASRKEWTAAAWQLERRFPDRYGRRTRVDGQVQVQALVVSQEWVELRDRMLDALQPFPEALAAVVNALRNGGSESGEIVGEVIGELTS